MEKILNYKVEVIIFLLCLLFILKEPKNYAHSKEMHFTAPLTNCNYFNRCVFFYAENNSVKIIPWKFLVFELWPF